MPYLSASNSSVPIRSYYLIELTQLLIVRQSSCRIYQWIVHD